MVLPQRPDHRPGRPWHSAVYNGDMPLWNVRREPAADPTHEPMLGAPSDELEPVALFCVEGVTEGSTDAMGRRMTELLNSRADIRINTPRESGAAEWHNFAMADVVAVAPPPHPSNPARRISRRKQRILLRAGEYRFVGTAHLPPGTDINAFLARRPGWMPLTECTIGTEEAEYEVDVAIVNTAHISEIERLLVSV